MAFLEARVSELENENGLLRARMGMPPAPAVTGPSAGTPSASASGKTTLTTTAVKGAVVMGGGDGGVDAAGTSPHWRGSGSSVLAAAFGPRSAFVPASTGGKECGLADELAVSVANYLPRYRLLRTGPAS